MPGSHLLTDPSPGGPAVPLNPVLAVDGVGDAVFPLVGDLLDQWISAEGEVVARAPLRLRNGANGKIAAAIAAELATARRPGVLGGRAFLDFRPGLPACHLRQPAAMPASYTMVWVGRTPPTLATLHPIWSGSIGRVIHVQIGNGTVSVGHGGSGHVVRAALPADADCILWISFDADGETLQVGANGREPIFTAPLVAATASASMDFGGHGGESYVAPFACLGVLRVGLHGNEAHVARRHRLVEALADHYRIALA